MTIARIFAVAALVAAPLLPALAQQPSPERTIEQYECKDLMREGGTNREVAIAFLHGFLLGKSGSSKFNLEVLQKQTDAFIDRCLNNPTEKASDAMMKVKS
jgi:hypothetical protein